jgi:hypothetical protein
MLTVNEYYKQKIIPIFEYDIETTITHTLSSIKYQFICHKTKYPYRLLYFITFNNYTLQWFIDNILQQKFCNTLQDSVEWDLPKKLILNKHNMFPIFSITKDHISFSKQICTIENIEKNKYKISSTQSNKFSIMQFEIMDFKLYFNVTF